MNIGLLQNKYYKGRYGDNISIEAESPEKIPMKPIEIITLEQHLIDRAAVEAWTKTTDVKEIDKLVDNLRKLNHNSAHEFVEIDENKITIGIHNDIIDENAIDYAFSLLSNVKDLNEKKRIRFGERIKINEKETN